MLTDLGLQTPEQVKIHKSELYSQSRGCVGHRICENCNHLISDSACFCLPIFTCPNCGFKNGKEIEEQILKSNISTEINECLDVIIKFSVC